MTIYILFNTSFLIKLLLSSFTITIRISFDFYFFATKLFQFTKFIFYKKKFSYGNLNTKKY